MQSAGLVSLTHMVNREERCLKLNVHSFKWIFKRLSIAVSTNLYTCAKVNQVWCKSIFHIRKKIIHTFYKTG